MCEDDIGQDTIANNGELMIFCLRKGVIRCTGGRCEGSADIADARPARFLDEVC